jgi:hypothetical protein
MPPRTEEFARLDGVLEGLSASVCSMGQMVDIMAAVMIGGFSILGFQLNRLESRLDHIEAANQAIPARLSDEFRAMRTEMAAQTRAIANSTTTIRQARPLPPQIIVVPAPQPGEKPTRP